jgi:3-hydroxyacyl-CoA dehydrogenase
MTDFRGVKYEELTVNQTNLAVFTLVNPPMNTLSTAVRRGLLQAIQTLRANPAIQGVLIQGANGVFCAGAEISEFQEGGKQIC